MNIIPCRCIKHLLISTVRVNQKKWKTFCWFSPEDGERYEEAEYPDVALPSNEEEEMPL